MKSIFERADGRSYMTPAIDFIAIYTEPVCAGSSVLDFFDYEFEEGETE